MLHKKEWAKSQIEIKKQIMHQIKLIHSKIQKYCRIKAYQTVYCKLTEGKKINQLQSKSARNTKGN